MVSKWFATRELDRRVWLVAEPGHVNSYLVAGRERAALIDSGLGIGDIRATVGSLTDLEVMVANTHHHWDHVEGNAGFSKVAIHELGEENLRAGQDLLFAEVYVAHARQRLARFGEFSEMDSKFYDFLADETTPPTVPGRVRFVGVAHSAMRTDQAATRRRRDRPRRPRAPRAPHAGALSGLRVLLR